MGTVQKIIPRQTKTKILAVAERILRTRGAADVTIRHVADKVRVSPMAIYRHFPSKDKLVAALVSNGFNIWEERLQRSISRVAPHRRLRAMMLAYLDFALQEKHLFELMFLTPRRNVPSAPASLEDTPSPAFSQVIESVEQSMASGRLAPGRVGDTILLVWSTAQGLITLHFAGRFGYSGDGFQDIFAKILDRQLKALNVH